MARRTITLTDAAYRRLKRLRRPGESFSDVVQRVVREPSARDFVGLLDSERDDPVDQGRPATAKGTGSGMG